MDKAESSCDSSASSLTRYEDDLNEIKAIINLGGRPPPQTHITVNPPPDIIPPNGHIKELTNLLQHALYEKERYKNALSAAERSNNLQHHEQFEKLLMKIAQLEKINKTKTDSTDVLIELDSIKTELYVQTKNNEHLQTELRELHETCNFKTACLTELKNKIADQHVELQIAHQKYNDIKRSETNLTNEINHCKKQLDWYKEQMIIKNQLTNEVITLKSSLASKTVEIENLNSEILQTKQLQQLESCKELSATKTELTSVKSTLQSKNIEIEKLKTELIDWKSKYSDTQLILNEQFQTDDYKQCTKEDDYKKLYELLKLEITNIQSNFAVQSIELDKITRENVEVVTKNATIHQQSELFKQNLHELDQQLVANKSQLQDAKLVIEKLNAALTAARKETYDNSDVIICIRNDFQKLLGVHKKLQDDLALKTSQTLQAQHEKQELFMRNSWDVCEIEGFKQRELEYLSVIKKHDGVIAEINRVNGVELECCKVQANKLLKELGDLKAIRADLEHKVGFYKESLDGLNTEVQGYQVRLNEIVKLVNEKTVMLDLVSKMNSDYEIKLKDCEDMCEKYESRVEVYVKNLQDKNGEIIVITNQFEDLEKCLFIKEQMLQNKNEEICSITKKLESFEKISSENTIKEQMLQDEISSITKCFENITIENTRLKQMLQDKDDVIYTITKTLEDFEKAACENTYKEQMLWDKTQELCAIQRKLEKMTLENTLKDKLLQDKNDEICTMTKLEDFEKSLLENSLKDKLLQDKDDEINGITKKLENLENMAIQITFQDKIIQDKNNEICAIKNEFEKVSSENIFNKQLLQDKNDEICTMTKKLEEFESNLLKDKLLQDKHYEINAIIKKVDDLENITLQNTFKDKMIEDKILDCNATNAEHNALKSHDLGSIKSENGSLDKQMQDYDASNIKNEDMKNKMFDFDCIKCETNVLDCDGNSVEKYIIRNDVMKSNVESIKLETNLLDCDANSVEKYPVQESECIKNFDIHNKFEEINVDKTNLDNININCKAFNEMKSEYNALINKLQDYEAKCILLTKLQGYKEQYEMKVWDYKKLQHNNTLITQNYETKLKEYKITSGVAIKSWEKQLKSLQEINNLYKLRLSTYVSPQEFDAQLNSKEQRYVNVVSDYEKQLQQKVMEIEKLQSELLSTRKQLMKDTDVNAVATNGSRMSSQKICMNDVVRLQDMVVVKNMEIQEKQKRYETNNRTLLRKIKELLNEKACIIKCYNEIKECTNETKINALYLQLKHANAELAQQSEMVTSKHTELVDLNDKLERLELQNTAVLKKTNEQLAEQVKVTEIKDAEIVALCLQLEQYKKMTADDIAMNQKEADRQALKCAELQEALRLVTSEKYFLQRLSSDLKIALNSTTKQNQMLRQKFLGPQREPDYHSLPQLVTNLPDSINIDRINSLLNRKTTDEKPLGNLHASLRSLKRQMALLQQEIVEKRNVASSL